MGYLSNWVPWWTKIPAKLVLSRLPVSYRFWRRVGLFGHGGMLDPGYASDVFYKHFEQARAVLPAGFRVLELGPGDSLATALFAFGEGADGTFLVDTGEFASRDSEAYRRLAERLGSGRRAAPAIFGTAEEMLAATGASYLTGGLASLRELPEASVDFTFSHAVLEHTHRDEFGATVKELFRLQRRGSVGSHQIDLRDHLSGGLQSLRFRPAVWESNLFRTSGFYTNRLRPSEIVAAFHEAGFTIQASRRESWPRPPLSRASLDPAFRSFSDEDLATFSLHLVVRKTT